MFTAAYRRLLPTAWLFRRPSFVRIAKDEAQPVQLETHQFSNHLRRDLGLQDSSHTDIIVEDMRRDITLRLRNF
jgi:hypothetical protein